ncbi:Wadjet anti-phage system protein JetD domain-containing protein [Planotetraspora mira]|uniref:DUF3322 and DUF2220 domain-containing protein n=1 Tax=Planotetraspora mira TaxID=58121 RepID=A0A8J3X959_9ACTN|nr:Wadjet anti-phage system protein JetD domain-containing protein [Planotetraspora mira]GII32872.1 hypothetical protein Pmi06nite_63140 [Planotetraspora mira]
MSWTTPQDIHSILRKRWTAGTYLRMLASGTTWEPLSLPIHGPKAGELAARFDQVRRWVSQWEATRSVRVEFKQAGGRTLGTNNLPARAWIDDYDQLWTLLNVHGDVKRFQEHLAATELPGVAAWMAINPMKVLEIADRWPEMNATVAWIHERATPGELYLRQIDVPGVDTKFVERHKAVLSALLDAQLEPERIDHDRPRSDFEGRYGFKKKPDYIRLRFLDGAAIAGFTELTVRASDFTTRPASVTTVFIVENEITYLAFPPVPNAIAIFGSGYSVALLQSLAWLNHTDLIYWGDIDTHGFAILDRLRARFPHTTSMLMDETTLLAHRPHWTREPAQSGHRLEHLTPAEAALYQALTTQTHGPAVRLEQERIRFSAVEQCVGAGSPPRPPTAPRISGPL